MNDIFYKRDMDQLKRAVMSKHKRGDNTQVELKAIIFKARDIEANRRSELSERPAESRMLLAYVEETHNA